MEIDLDISYIFYAGSEDLCTFTYLYGEPAPFSADSKSCKMDMPANINPCKNTLESVEIVENAQFCEIK